jgi:hypothetical protein
MTVGIVRDAAYGWFYTSAQDEAVETPHKTRGDANRTFSEEIYYKKARLNLDERFWRVQFGVSQASSDFNAAGGVVNASARNVVQSTLRRFIFWNLADY